MQPTSFAILVLNECMRDMHTKFNNPDIRFKSRPAKASELLALQRRINKPRGHYYLQQEHAL